MSPAGRRRSSLPFSDVRIFDRHDLFLLAGFTIALVVVFARPLRYVLDLARDVEETYGLALVPALIVLAVVFLFQQQSKRQELHLSMAAAETQATQALQRAQELERLVAFGQALSRSLEMDTLREAVWRHLPSVAGTQDAWVLIRSSGSWEALIGGSREGPADVELLRAAEAASQQFGPRVPASEPLQCFGHLCMPLVVGDTVVGIVGAREATLGESERRMLAAGAALLAIALQNVQLFRELKQNSLYDGLTHCLNRTHGMERLESELRRARRSRSPLSVIMFDLDHFKSINDRHGHLCGDAVLAGVGRLLRDVLRTSDLKCRYGGEEFLVILPETPMLGARRVADSLRQEISDIPIVWNAETVHVTASFGVAAAEPGELDPAALLTRADALLYRAKEKGRNRVCVSESPIPEDPADPAPALKLIPPAAFKAG